MTQTRFAGEPPQFTLGQVRRAREIVGEIAAAREEIARIEGRVLEGIAELASIADAASRDSSASDAPEYARRTVVAELAAATNVHPQAARAQMDDAERLTDDYPQTIDALKAGRIALPHARAIADAGRHLDPDARASLDSCAVPYAETRTPSALRRIVRKQAADLSSESPHERHETARADRRVSLTELTDGMSELNVIAPTFELRTIHDRLTRMGRRVKVDRRRARSAFIREHGDAPEDVVSAPGELPVAATDRRTMDQLRADILGDLLLTATPTGHRLHASGTGATLEDVRATVQVTIPVAQLIDPDAGTSWMDDGAIISSRMARLLAGSAAGWDRVFIRPESGEVVATDRYRPTSAQRRALRGRDMTCRFPGCSTPAVRSDIDHSHDHARGGATRVENLSALCEAHHTVKHAAGWIPVQLGGGVIEWLSPLGYTYRDEPASRAFFRDTVGMNGARHDRETGEPERRRTERERHRASERARERREQAVMREDDARADRLAASSQPPPWFETDIYDPIWGGS